MANVKDAGVQGSTGEHATGPAPTGPDQATASPIMGTLATLAREGGSPQAMAQSIQERGLPLAPPLLAALNALLGSAAAGQVIAALQTPKPEAATPAPTPTAPMVEQGGGEPTASPAALKAVVPVGPTIERGPAVTAAVSAAAASGGGASDLLCPAPAIVFDEVGATLAALGFAASGKQMPIKAHTAPTLTPTGFEFNSSAVNDADGRAKSTTTVATDYGEGMGKKHATGALAGSDDVTLNPAGDFTTLIHETVHLYQTGEIGRYLVEPMTDIIAAMAFTRLADKGIVTGAYAYAPEYMPWIVFVKEVIAPKIGWPRLFGYYVGQGMKNFDELAAELGFRPVAPPMKALKEALANGDVAKAEAQRPAILAGPAANQNARAFDKKGAALDAAAPDMTSFEAWLPTFGAVITAAQKPGEAPAQTAGRLALENKRSVIEGALREAREHKATAVPGLQGEIDAFIAAYSNALAELPA